MKPACQRGQNTMAIIVQESSRATTRLITSEIEHCCAKCHLRSTYGTLSQMGHYMGNGKHGKDAWAEENQEFFCIMLMEGLDQGVWRGITMVPMSWEIKARSHQFLGHSSRNLFISCTRAGAQLQTRSYCDGARCAECHTSVYWNTICDHGKNRLEVWNWTLWLCDCCYNT